jgi:glycosyltransferase involved in cell wall biosynthesis
VPRFSSPALRRLVTAESRRGCDVAVVDHVWMAWAAPALRGVPLVFSTQNVESALLAAKAGAEAHRGIGLALVRREIDALRRAEAAMVRRAAVTVAVSGNDAALLAALATSARVEVVANGTDLAGAPPLPPPSFDPPRLLYLGGYDYAPNLDAATALAREVLPAVRRSAPGAEALIAGADRTGALEGLRALPGVRVLGRVESAADAYAGASALVVPLRFGGGSRLKIIEAWALGRPVVSTPQGAEGLDAADGEHLLLANDAAAFAAAIGRLAADHALRARLVDNGRRRAARDHDWRALGERFRLLVEEAARPPGIKRAPLA